MVSDIKANNTTLFLVPPLGLGDTRKLKEQGFLGAYLGDVRRPNIHYEKGVFMLFKPDNLIMFQAWLEEQKILNTNLVDDYDYDDGYVVIVCLLPYEFSRDYEKFLNGQYSKMSIKFKNMFPKTVPVRNKLGVKKEKPSWQWMVFNRDEEIRKEWEETLDVSIPPDAEVWSSPTIDNELLNIENVKNDVQHRNSG